MRLHQPDRLAALLPTYTDQGDQVQILYQDGGKENTPRRLSTCLRRLARLHTLDLIALREDQQRKTLRKLLQPLPFSPKLILVPVKIRKPRLPKDIAYGYFNACAVKQIKPLSSCSTRLELAGQHEAIALWSCQTVLRALHRAETCRPPQLYYTTPLVSKLAEIVQEILSLTWRPS